MNTNKFSKQFKKVNLIKGLHLLFIAFLVIVTLGITPTIPAQAEMSLPISSSPEGSLNPAITSEWLSQLEAFLQQDQFLSFPEDSASGAQAQSDHFSPKSTYQWVAYGDYDNNRFGYSISSAGDVNGDGYSDVIVGAPYYDPTLYREGKAYVFYGSASGLSSSPSWTAESDQADAYLGYSVSTAGDVNGDGYSDIIVGAPGYDSVSPTTYGLALIWYGSGTGLGANGTVANADWKGIWDQQNSEFGSVVATAGDVDGNGYSDVMVGAPYNDSTFTESGAVVVYHGSSSGPSLTPSTWTTGYAAYDHLGTSISTAGDFNGDGYSDVLMGSPDSDSASLGPDTGSVRFYAGSSSGLSSTPGWIFLGLKSNSRAGSSVSTAGDVNGDGYSDALIGAPEYNVDVSNLMVGEAYVVYGETTSAFNPLPDWTARGTQAEAKFGFSVASAGDVNGDGYADLLVGQPLYDNLVYSVVNSGRAYIWHGNLSGLGLDGTENNADWRFENIISDSRSGFSVATAGDWNGDGYSDVLVSQPYWGTEEGSVFGFQGTPILDLGSSSSWSYESNNNSANLGYSVSKAGDVNGDGYADYIVGAPYYQSGGSQYGAAFVWYGGPSLASWSTLGPQLNSQFGISVSSAGDVNGDGYDDIIVGAQSTTNGQASEGQAFVWYGSSGGLSIWGASWSAESDQSNSSFGASVSSAGDVNGDGYFDIVVGAPNYTNGNTNEGAVFIWYGGEGGLGSIGKPSNSDWYREGNTDNLYLGRSVSTAGDVKKSGYSSVISGAMSNAYAWYGSATGLPASGFDWQISSSGGFGTSVSTAGDINGDGYADVLVGAPLASNAPYSEDGAVFGFCGSSTGLPGSTCWYDTGGRQSAMLGYSMSSAGDVNGDGYADILVGAPGWSQTDYNEGQVRLYYGSFSGPASGNGGDWTVETTSSDAYLGYSVSSAGDINGDGYADVLAGLPYYTNGSFEEGQAKLFLGNGSSGKPFLPRQLRILGGKPIANLGRSDWQTAFNLRLTGFSPFGRSKFNLEWEVKQFPTNFTGFGTEQGSGWADTGVLGSTLTIPKYGLSLDTPYHWRVRIKYNLVASPFSPTNSRWFHMPWNGWNEQDFKTATLGTITQSLYLPIVKRN